MKWLYIKNGDAVAQLKRVSADPISINESGPDAFLADLLSGILGESMLIISWDKRNDEWVDRSIRARTYRATGSPVGRVGNAVLRIFATVAGAREIVAFRPDRIICGRVGPMLWMTALVARWLRCPFLHSRHNSLYEQQAKWYQRVLSKLDFIAIRAAKAVICHGPYLVSQMQSLGIPSDKLFEFDVSLARFQKEAKRAREAQGGLRREKTLIYVGRIERNKGVFDLLEASADLLASDSLVELHYVGDGPDLEDLRTAAEALGFAGRIEFAGRVRHEDLPGIIASAFVVVTPTRREFPEGRCMAAMEALACAVPVIGPAYGPFPYLIASEHNGLLYEPDDVTALSRALRRMVRDPGVHAQLRAGAAQTAAKLCHPTRTFYQAVCQVFDG